MLPDVASQSLIDAGIKKNVGQVATTIDNIGMLLKANTLMNHLMPQIEQRHTKSDGFLFKNGKLNVINKAV